MSTVPSTCLAIAVQSKDAAAVAVGVRYTEAALPPRTLVLARLASHLESYRRRMDGNLERPVKQTDRRWSNRSSTSTEILLDLGGENGGGRTPWPANKWPCAVRRDYCVCVVKSRWLIWRMETACQCADELPDQSSTRISKLFCIILREGLHDRRKCRFTVV